jgi:hypothetical protein
MVDAIVFASAFQRDLIATKKRRTVYTYLQIKYLVEAFLIVVGEAFLIVVGEVSLIVLFSSRFFVFFYIATLDQNLKESA